MLYDSVQVSSKFFVEIVYDFSELLFPLVIEDHFFCLYWLSHMRNDEINVVSSRVDEPLQRLLHVTLDFSVVGISLFFEVVREIFFLLPPLFKVDCS